jgi:hypothetical protein
MRLRAPLAVPVVLLFVLAGCANNKPGAPTGTPTNSAGCPMALSVTADDNQKTMCVALGGTVTVNLQSPGATHWLRIESSGTALSESNATPSTARLTSTALFNAVSVGESTINSARPNCPTQSVQTGVSCHSIMAWKVTIEVK